MSQTGDEGMSCIVCSNEFDNCDHQPVALPACGHTFCRPCILKLDRTKLILRCPECRKPHEGEAPANLPQNHQLLNYIANQSQNDNSCVKTDDSGSQQRGGAKRKHFQKKIKKHRKNNNANGDSHPPSKDDDERDHGSSDRSCCKKETDSESDSGKGSGMEEESDTDLCRTRRDDDLSCDKEDSDDSLNPQRKNSDTTTCVDRREHDDDSPADGSSSRSNNMNQNLILQPTFNDTSRINGATDQLLNFVIKIKNDRHHKFWTKKRLKIFHVVIAICIMLLFLSALPLSYKILDGMGFTSRGIRSNSYASSWQSEIQKNNQGRIEKDSWFSFLQKAANKGFSVKWEVLIVIVGIFCGLLFLPFVFCSYKRSLKKCTAHENHIRVPTEEDTTV